MDALHLVEDDAGGLVDPEDSDNGSRYSDTKCQEVIGHGQEEDIVVLDTVRLVGHVPPAIVCRIDDGRCGCDSLFLRSRRRDLVLRRIAPRHDDKALLKVE
jgi:hypothetical protein